MAALIWAVVACGGASNSGSVSCRASGSRLTGGSACFTASILENWLAEPEQGGDWEAQAEGLGMNAGVQLQVQQGGPRVSPITLVAAGSFQFGRAQSDEILQAQARGVPVVMVAALNYNYPQCLMYHTGTGINSIQDINGHPVAMSLAQGYWAWIKAYYHLDNAHQVPTTGGITQFRSNPSLVQQCFLTNEPYLATQAGVAHAEFWLPSLGYNPYPGLFTTEDMIAKHPDIVRAVVAAVMQGWRDFIKDPSKARDVIAKLDKVYADSPGLFDYSYTQLKAKMMWPSPGQYGCMTHARWQTLTKQLQDAGVLPPSFDYTKAVSFQFVSGCPSG